MAAIERKPIGAEVTYYQTINNGIDVSLHGYVSFGQYVEQTESDSFGVVDEVILYYAENAAELDELMKANSGKIPFTGFVITDYTLIFQD